MRRKSLALAFLVFASLSRLQAQTFNLFAAASLKESVTEISKAFQKTHKDVVFSLNFGGSQQLVAQIRQGAPVDVLLSAGVEALGPLTNKKEPLRIFATNKLAIVVPANSNKVRLLQDLDRGARLILADRHVPVGNYTEIMFAKVQKDLGKRWLDGVKRNVISKEQDVRAVLAKVSLGEADAGIVYVTDSMAAKGKVKVIPIPNKYNVSARYPAVQFDDSPSKELAMDFVAFLLQKEAQTILARHGFGSPH